MPINGASGYTQACGQVQIAAATETNWDIDVGSSNFIAVDRVRVGQNTHTTSSWAPSNP